MDYLVKLFSKDSSASFGRVMAFVLIIGALISTNYAIFMQQIPQGLYAWGLYALPYVFGFLFYLITKWADLKLTDILNRVIDERK